MGTLQLRLKFVRHVIMSNSRENSDWSGSKNGSEERKERQEPGDGVSGMDPGGVIESNWDKVCDSFDEMNLKEKLLRGIYAYGFERPSAIQQRAILPCITGHDVIAQAQSGTGKRPRFPCRCSSKSTRRSTNVRPWFWRPRVSWPIKFRKWFYRWAITWKCSVTRASVAPTSVTICANWSRASTSWWARPAASST